MTINAGEKTIKFEEKDFFCTIKFRWTDGFFFENSRVCTSDLYHSYIAENSQFKHDISGYTQKAEWAGAYTIYFEIKFYFMDDNLSPATISKHIVIEEKDLYIHYH